jgi:V/A-type H+-transporting ATPase subunit E
MAEELQQLLEKIQHDGVEKANAEAAAIISKAKAEAEACKKAAAEEAAAATAKAEAEAKASAERAEKTIQQAARDTIREVKNALDALFENLLAKNVNAALSTPGEAAKIALDAIRSLNADDAEVAANEKLAAALKAQLVADAAKGVKVVLDPTVGSGFSIRLDGGRVEHDFSEAAISAAIAKRLRPALAALLAN